MKDHVFRRYDIRGAVGEDFVLDEVYALASAIAVYILQQNPTVRTVALGRDTRSHSGHIFSMVSAALMDSGLHVLSLGVCPTPVVQFALHTLPVDAGIMITASHNNHHYNGLKLMLGRFPLWGEQIVAIRQLYHNRATYRSGTKGEMYRYDDFVNRYIEWLYHHFSALHGASIPIVFDCGNGATSTVIPSLIHRFDLTNSIVLCDGATMHDGSHEADPVVIENMYDVQVAIGQYSAQLGIGFDGDGDRMGAMTHTGHLVSGDRLLLLYAQDIVRTYPDCVVIYDAKCSRIVPEGVRSLGGIPHQSPSGHSLIRSRMKLLRALLGGELSCHFFFADRYFGYDDGIYAALRLIELLIRKQDSLHTLMSKIPRTYATTELRLSCDETEKNIIVERVRHYLGRHHAVKELRDIDGVHALTNDGWGMIRASHTQSVICVRCESMTVEGLYTITSIIRSALVSHSGATCWSADQFDSWVARAAVYAMS